MLMVSDDSSWSCCYRSLVLQISMIGTHLLFLLRNVTTEARSERTTGPQA